MRTRTLVNQLAMAKGNWQTLLIPCLAYYNKTSLITIISYCLLHIVYCLLFFYLFRYS
jgi:hypothetical protein